MPTSSPNPCPDHPPPHTHTHTHTHHYTGSPSDQLPFAPTPTFLRCMVHEREFNAFLANKVWTTAFISSANISKWNSSATASPIDSFLEAFERARHLRFDAFLILRIGEKNAVRLRVFMYVRVCVRCFVDKSWLMGLYILFGMLGCRYIQKAHCLSFPKRF